MSIACPAGDDTIATASARERAGAASTRAIIVWLSICAALVFAIVVVGGVTRLTHSGLSITEWQPIAGALPPLDAADWNDAFSGYQATPEFREVNYAMTLPEFKRIYWWEYLHRLLGRVVGIAFLAPYLWFLARGRIPRGYAWPLAGIFTLGALQGGVGWLMVQSGLVDAPRISPLRLTAHLGLAFAIFGALLWTVLSLVFPARADSATNDARSLRRAALVLAGLVFVTVLSGGLVAGIRAGFAYNTFPLMAGRVVPSEILMLDPWWSNFFWNMATVQFDHRLFAWLLILLVPLFWWRLAHGGAPRRARRRALAHAQSLNKWRTTLPKEPHG